MASKVFYLKASSLSEIETPLGLRYYMSVQSDLPQGRRLNVYSMRLLSQRCAHSLLNTALMLTRLQSTLIAVISMA